MNSALSPTRSGQGYAPSPLSFTIPHMSHPLNLQDVVTITKEAGQILLEKFEQDIDIDLKTPDDVVTEADHAAERFLKEKLLTLFPGSGFHGEESGQDLGSNGYTWVVDPLDGTHNYSEGIPLWGCSVGLLDSEMKPVLGVLDFPTVKKTQWAEAGGGAFLDGKPIHVSTDPLIPTSVIGVQSKIRLEKFPGHVEYASRYHSARSLGSIAYHGYLVSTGRMRGSADLKVRLHDIVAVTVIVQEAGGWVSDLDGMPIFPLQREFPYYVDAPVPFFAGDPVTGPDLLKALFPDGTPDGTFGE
ncbi:MAG: inositol monophosphatase [Candidatus Omnitrophica bacterium]|nr:inositol monophosphatase [Candidatus Omnitrophota bacterium]